MKIEYVKTSQIKPYEKNPRDNSKAIEKVMESLKEFGWQQPLVLDKDYTIIVGHTRFKAAQNLGYDEVPCIIASDLTDVQAKAYRLADNKTSDFSVWDNKLLLEELDAIDELDPNVFTGFDWGGVFDNVLDETNKDSVIDNINGVVYEVTFKSEDKAKIEKIIGIWETEVKGNEE